jgi:hypothetical protein
MGKGVMADMARVADMARTEGDVMGGSNAGSVGGADCPVVAKPLQPPAALVATREARPAVALSVPVEMVMLSMAA